LLVATSYPVAIVTLRVTSTGRLPRLEERRAPPAVGARGRQRRRAFLKGEWREVDIYFRGELREPPGTHHLDMGGIAAGSYGATATEIFQEVRIPPVKLFKRGTLNEEVLP
jgi:hypothetical protein